jgi:hypothetical protein
MALKTVMLEAFTDEQTGELGLGIVGMRSTHETNAATDGILLAHDLIEHVNGVEQIGTIDDELEALGAIWFTRGQYYDLTRDGRGSAYPPQYPIASDIARMFREFFHGSAHVDLSPLRSRPCDADSDLKDIVREALKQTRDEIGDDRDAGEPDLIKMERAYIRVCLPRMRIGYRKAQRKYKTGGRANELFWAVAEAVGVFCKSPEFEGARYQLRYGFDKRGQAVAHCDYHWEE